jgi:hypothetical protein
MIFKHYNLNLGLDDQELLFDFLKLDAPKNHYNLHNLSRLFEIMARISFKTQKEKLRGVPSAEGTGNKIAMPSD